MLTHLVDIFPKAYPDERLTDILEECLTVEEIHRINMFMNEKLRERKFRYKQKKCQN